MEFVTPIWRVFLLLAAASTTLAQFLRPAPLYHSDIFFQPPPGPRHPGFLLRRAAPALFYRPLLAAGGLFTPNTAQQPAETAGQVENYRKALEEEADEAEKERRALGVGFGRSYVNVRVAGQDQYGYST